MEEVPYEYILLSMFNNLKKFGNKSSVNVQDAIKYVNKYIELVKKYAKEYDKKNLKLIEYDVKEEIDSFLRIYGEYFYEQGDKLYLRDDFDYSILDEEMFNNSVSNRVEPYFRVPTEDLELLETIGATYSHKEFGRLLKQEMQLEKAYIEYIKNPTKDNKRKLQTHMLLKFSSLEVLKRIPLYSMDAVFLSTIDYADDNELTYAKSPYNEKLWDDFLHIQKSDLEELLIDLPHYAIYGNDSMAFKKLESEIDGIHEETSKDPLGLLELLFANKKEEEKLSQIFFLKYLMNLNEYLETHEPTEEELKTKARLMYYFDSPYICLFNEQNLENYYKKTATGTFNFSSILKISDEARYLSGEIFYYPDEKTITQKLMLMKTYYDITHDEDFALLFASFRDQPKYEEYCKTIFGENKSLIL